MNGAREHDPVRATTAVEIVPGGRVVPAGAEGAGPDGSRLAGVALAPQTAADDGDFVQVVLGQQYEVIRVHDHDQGGTRPGSAFKGGSVVFVTGPSQNRDGYEITSTYPKPREDALPTYGRCDYRWEAP